MRLCTCTSSARLSHSSSTSAYASAAAALRQQRLGLLFFRHRFAAVCSELQLHQRIFGDFSACASSMDSDIDRVQSCVSPAATTYCAVCQQCHFVNSIKAATVTVPFDGNCALAATSKNSQLLDHVQQHATCARASAPTMNSSTCALPQRQ